MKKKQAKAKRTPKPVPKATAALVAAPVAPNPTWVKDIQREIIQSLWDVNHSVQQIRQMTDGIGNNLACMMRIAYLWPAHWMNRTPATDGQIRAHQ